MPSMVLVCMTAGIGTLCVLSDIVYCSKCCLDSCTQTTILPPAQKWISIFCGQRGHLVDHTLPHTLVDKLKDVICKWKHQPLLWWINRSWHMLLFNFPSRNLTTCIPTVGRNIIVAFSAVTWAFSWEKKCCPNGSDCFKEANLDYEKLSWQYLITTLIILLELISPKRATLL